MRNKKISATFFITLLIYALINLILFLNVDSLRTDSAVFWIAWAIAFPVQLLILAYLGFAVKWKSVLIQKPMLYPIVISALVVYLAVGFIFMLCPIESVKAIVITEAIITVIYIILLFLAKRSADFITGSQAYTKRKVAFLRMLKADVDDISLFVTDPALSAALAELSDKIRYSDPMSSPALASYESSISERIALASMQARSGNVAGALTLINEASMLLESRNQRCKLLK